MASWEQLYPTIDFKILQGYSTHFDTKWSNNLPRFWGLPTPHIVNFLEYISEVESGGEDALIKLFILSCHPSCKIGLRVVEKIGVYHLSYTSSIGLLTLPNHVAKRMKMPFRISQ
jgi:hypothetical protein